MEIMLDDGRLVAFDRKDYADLDHGYAATIHKAQGLTIDKVHVLATPGLDRHAAYVALSRHRDGVEVHYGRDDFADRARLVRTLSRERGKDMASDYVPAFAERRQIALRERVGQGALMRVPRPDADLKLEAGPSTPAAPPKLPSHERSGALPTAVTRHARIVRAMRFTHSVEEPYTPEQRQEMAASRAGLDAIRSYAAIDLERAFASDLGLIHEAAEGRTTASIRAMRFEAELRANPQLRADTFVQRWQTLDRQRRLFLRDREDSRANAVGKRMLGMAKGLERDPQVESILRHRKAQLGLPDISGKSVGRSLAELVARGRSRGLGIGM
jgi:hypothetical protein